ncbi:hypothetical protein GCM10023317_12680 [Actinopolymorpha pittospori]
MTHTASVVGVRVVGRDDPGHGWVVDLDEAALRLYGLPPEEFTAARNDLAKRTSADGDTATGTAIKALRKPTLAAWLANQLVRADPDGVSELTKLGEELREAHLSGDGDRLRDLSPRRHELVQKLVQSARTHAKDGGHKVTDGVADRLTETLDAALVDPDAGQLLRSGVLTSALRHVGFGVVDETGEPAQVIPIRTTPTERRTAPGKADKAARRKDEDRGGDARRRKELQEKVAQATADLDAAEAERAQAEAELDANEHHVDDMRTAVERLTEELDKARRELRKAESRTASLERSLTSATRAAATARRRLDAARTAQP